MDSDRLSIVKPSRHGMLLCPSSLHCVLRTLNATGTARSELQHTQLFVVFSCLERSPYMHVVARCMGLVSSKVFEVTSDARGCMAHLMSVPWSIHYQKVLESVWPPVQNVSMGQWRTCLISLRGRHLKELLYVCATGSHKVDFLSFSECCHMTGGSAHELP